MSSREHLVSLPSRLGSWSVWRWSCLRAAGFPAELVLRLAAPSAGLAADQLLDLNTQIENLRAKIIARLTVLQDEATVQRVAVPAIDNASKKLRRGLLPARTGTDADAAIDELRDLESRAAPLKTELMSALQAEGGRISASLCEVAQTSDFREALAWQNRNALRTAVAPMLRQEPNARTGSKYRQHEELVASYLQRYCAKNDTIGFFGPVGWAKLGEGSGIEIRPGESLLAQRSVHFEQWPIDTLASQVTKDPRMEPWLMPRLLPFVRVDGAVAVSNASGTQELDEEEEIVLAACDGNRTARALAEVLTYERPDLVPTEDDLLVILRRLRDKELIAWTLEVPLGWNADATFRALLQRIGDEVLRAALLSPLDELERGRVRVAAAGGDADALEAALGDLDQTFVRLTGEAAVRNAGAMYAGRGLVFEDARRNVNASVSAEVLASIGPALSLVLTSARWVTHEIGRAYRERFRAIYNDLARQTRSPAVPFDQLWYRAQSALFGAKDRPIDEVNAELDRRWSSVLRIDSTARSVQLDSAALATEVAAAFPAPGPGWSLARHHSPDLMIAAESLDAIRHGDWEAVLGEIHVGCNTLDTALFVQQHPQPEELAAAHEADLPKRMLMQVMSKDTPKVTTRTSRGFEPPAFPFLEMSADRAPGRREPVYRIVDFTVVEKGGGLVACGPDGIEIELLELLGEHMSELSSSGFQVLPLSDHRPRITIDKLIVARETWQVMPSALGFAYETTPEARFLAARKWARSLGLPRFCFVKSKIEVKPVYVDFDSPIYVSMLAKLVRRTRDHVNGETAIVVSEMVPGLNQTWVPDAADRRYTSEIRIVVVDDGPETR